MEVQARAGNRCWIRKGQYLESSREAQNRSSRYGALFPLRRYFFSTSAYGYLECKEARYPMKCLTYIPIHSIKCPEAKLIQYCISWAIE